MTGLLAAEEINACADLVRRGDPDRFLIAMSAPPPARERLFPILALNVEVSRAPWLTSEPMIAEIRVQWWREAVEEAGAGAVPRAHEVAGPLAKLITGVGLPIDELDAMITARRWDIEPGTFDDQVDLDTHIEDTGGRLLWLCAAALGAPDALRGRAMDAGYAMGLANWLMAIPALEAAGCRPLVDGRPEAVAALARAGLARLSQARRLRGADAARPAFRLATFAGPILRQAVRDPAAVAEGRLGLSEFSRRWRVLYNSVTGGW